MEFSHSAIGLLIMSATALLVSNAVATQFTVGGSGVWTCPSNNVNGYNQWAEKMRFQIGDSLLFVYHSDSVLEVTKPDYDSCNTGSPLKKYTDGHTAVKFDHSGPHYFISGNKDHCQKGEKILVIVMADRSGNKPHPAASPPAPSAVQSPPAPAPEAPVPSSSPPPAPSTLTPHPKNNAAGVQDIAGFVGALTSGIAFLIMAS